ncbi:MAG: hypothetical protein ACXVAY_16270 [Mucilaginibacter sp.]
MENLKTFTWKKNYNAYLVAAVAFILLFCVGRFENTFDTWFNDGEPNTVLPGFSLHKLLLFVFDMSLWFVIVNPLKEEDERVEKIRGFALKQTFTMGCITAAGMGFLMNTNFSLLNYVAIIEIYYLFLFQLYLYRDSRIVYLTTAERKAKEKAIKKKLFIFIVIQGLFQGFLMGYLDNHYHRPDFLWISIAIYIGILSIAAAVYGAWKK